MLTYMQDEILISFLFNPYKRDAHHLTLCWQAANTGHVKDNKKM